MATSTSSPIKPLRPNCAAHNGHEIEKFVVKEEISLEQFWEELHYEPANFQQRKFSHRYRLKGDFQDYMEKISDKMRERCGLPPDRLIQFHDTSTTPPLDHPTGTSCKPDFSACCTSAGRVHWTAIDATVEIHSAGTSATAGPHQAASYTFYLLQARPDRISVQGFYVDEKGIVLIISNAEGVKKSPKLKISETSDVQLLYAFVRRLYDPHPSMLDPTVKRRRDSLSDSWVFDITLTIPNSPSAECVGYRILSARGSVGQRTHVFVNNEHPARLADGVCIPVIKDQYRYQNHRFDEAEVIRHIHANGNIPGVVQIMHSQVILRKDGSPVCSGDRHKTRICLLEYGKPFMDLKTPLEALIAIYDLLEITRLIYSKRKVLHRDISTGNVMVIERDRAVSSLPANAGESNKSSHPSKFYTVKHLLDPAVEPSATSNLLIDFDRAEILNAKQGERRLERTGTPMFMARAVRAGKPIGRVGKTLEFESMPELSDVARKAYERVFPDRLARFPHSSTHPLIKIKTSADPSAWRHELRHDAESAYWLLVWWAMTAFPTGGTMTEIAIEIWGMLIATEFDTRTCEFSELMLDPVYSPLAVLLNQLGGAVLHDHHWATDAPYTDPEFIHEAFQRHILNFISANQHAEFMKHPKADTLRKPKGFTEISSLSTPPIDSLRQFSGAKRSRDSEPEPGPSKKLRS